MEVIAFASNLIVNDNVMLHEELAAWHMEVIAFASNLIVNDNVMLHEELAAWHIEVIAFASNLIANDNFMLREEPHYDPTCWFFISTLLILFFFNVIW